MSKIRYERIAVSPGLAAQWLRKNVDNNRSPKTNKIPTYARDMARGKWQEDSGETIKFNDRDELIDGQNRLRAVVLAGVTVSFDVVFGVPSDAMKVIDTGAARTAADYLKIFGAPSRTRAGSVVRWVLLWDAGYKTGQAAGFRPSNTEIVERYEVEPDAFTAATARGGDCQRYNLSTGTVAAVAFYLFSRVDSERCHQFFDQFVTGADLAEKSPVLVLRNKLSRMRLDRLTRPEQLALFVRAWNAFREDRPLDRMLIVKGDLTNSNFPVPR